MPHEASVIIFYEKQFGMVIDAIGWISTLIMMLIHL
jgi:hypothetical protein